jgi:hypothetical protein
MNQTAEAFAEHMQRRLRAMKRLRLYPRFYLYNLGGARYSIVCKDRPHRGAVLGTVEGDEVRLYGVLNFRKLGGLAWQNFSKHERFQMMPERLKGTL